MAPTSEQPFLQLFWLFVLAIPIACIAWTITHEEVFREPRDYCKHRSKTCQTIVARKFFYLFTCEYCFSHYVTAVFVILTRYRLLIDGWLGYVISFFSLVLVANIYMSLYSRLRVDIRSERNEADVKEREVEVKEKEIQVKQKELEAKDQEIEMMKSHAGN